MANILLSGVPGTGKTTTAEYLAAHHGYQHTDIEADGFALRHQFNVDFQTTLHRIVTGSKSVVISWGFGPFGDRPIIQKIVDSGFKPIWLDGNRIASFRVFMERENRDPSAELAYYSQMQMIVATEIVDRLKPTVINPFRADGTFRPSAEIASEIIRLTKK